jgi:hypothetical protein
VTDYDPYNNSVQHFNTTQERDAWMKRRRTGFENDRLQTRMDQYNQYADKYRNQLLGVFNMGADTAAGHAIGGAASGVQRALLRGGLEGGGLSQALVARERGNVLNTAAAQKMDFSQKLLQYQQEGSNAVLTKQLDYFNELERMRYNEGLQERFAGFQARLAQDEQSRNAFLGALGSIARFGASFLLPAVGPMTQQNPVTFTPDPRTAPVFGPTR